MKTLALISILFGLLAACTSPTPTTIPQATLPVMFPTQTLSGDKQPAFISFAELQITHRAPVQALLHVTGDLPTPCNQFAAEVDQPDAQKNIQVRVFSVVKTDAMCTQVLQPFDEIFEIEIVNKFDGVYTVFLNGQAIGQIVVERGVIAAVSV